MKKSVFGIATVTLVVILLTATAAFAQSPTVDPRANRMEKAQDRCQKVTSALNGRITSAQARISARESFADRFNTQIQEKIQKLQSLGADVTKLQADATQFASLLDTWVADYKTYVANLQAAQNLNCGTSAGQFKAALQTARDSHKKVIEDRKIIQDFLKNTLKPDFKAARASVKPTAKPS